MQAWHAKNNETAGNAADWKNTSASEAGERALDACGSQAKEYGSRRLPIEAAGTGSEQARISEDSRAEVGGNGQEARESARAWEIQAPDSYPVLVYCRGGIGRVGRVRLDWLAEFASFGHIVLAPCYRGGESGVGHDEFGGADLEDSRVAVRLARAIPGADPSRIAVLGFSRGSINATDAAIAEDASRLILWGGLSDLAVTYEERIDLRRMLKRVIRGSAYKLPDVYRERSPIDMAKRLDCPVLIMHGTEDTQVDYGHGERMYAELRRLGKSVTLARLEGLGHHMAQETRMRVLAEMFAWLEAKPQEP
ncbi:hypothetical protein B9G55_06905 [Saccharibacillus sp. O16]|nr:hypothetical protein B9G55_06905 [Saccharibacillus sp. O16]